jgi:hypothetical protein
MVTKTKFKIVPLCERIEKKIDLLLDFIDSDEWERLKVRIDEEEFSLKVKQDKAILKDLYDCLNLSIEKVKFLNSEFTVNGEEISVK